MKNQKIIPHKLNKNQYLSQIEPFKSKGIPTDSILFKELPGCGATRCEIEFHRHSIIIEPNVPVIIGKKKQFGALVCAIYEGVTTDEILEYLENKVEHKKLIVTPESYPKVRDAIEESNFNMFADFFLLFDECEKIIQDVDYRPDIALPLEDFFLFKNKAFVSATPIIPSDPRFISNNFKLHKITPTFDYAQQLRLITTNNVMTTIGRFVNENPREKYFIFLNSTDTIDEVIKKLKIEEESVVFCADKSRKKLLMNDYTRSSVKTEISSFKKFNFFTSRFFSAVDIDYSLFQCNPTIILVTDIVSAHHSMLDPFTEVIQIQGRFRETKENPFTREIIHISNVKNDLTSLTRDEVLSYLNECHIIYKAVHRFHESATTMAAKDVLSQVLKRIDYAKYLKRHSFERNFDMIDNLIFEERVKGIYQSAEKLEEAYESSNHFTLMNNSQNEQYTFDDKKRKEADKNNVRLKSLHKIVSETLQALFKRKSNGELTDFEYLMEITNLQIDFPIQMAPINRFGIENSAALKFNIRTIENQLLQEKKQVDHFAMMTYIQTALQIGKIYTSSHLVSILKAGLKANKILFVSATLQYLRKNFAELSEKREYMGIDKNGKEIRGYKILRFKDGSLN